MALPALPAGMMKELVDRVGKDKVASVVTDNPSAMRLARQLLTSLDGYKHILGFRCYMHLFALIMNSVVSHPYARGLVAKAQKIVTYFRASHGRCRCCWRQPLRWASRAPSRPPTRPA